MQYKPSLWDGSDPLYAPGLMYVAKVYPRWQPPKRYRDAGCPIKGEKLVGKKGDDNNLSRAARCRALTQDMVRWWDGEQVKAIKPGTWAEIIGRYQTDKYSTIQSVKGNTRAEYLSQTAIWDRIIGHMTVASLDYTQMMDILDAMRAKGRSVSYISRAMGQLRRLAKYASLIKSPGIADVRQMLTDIRVQSPTSRSVEITRDQVRAIVDECDARGLADLACGYLMQYEFSLRAVDIRGQWFPGEGGVNRGGKRWQDGLTWDMIDKDVATMTKVISKTAKSLPEAYEFDLAAIPEIQGRLQLMRNGGGVGPVFVSNDGLPYSIYGWSQAFRRIRDDLKLPDNLTSMDLRAGGITEAKRLVKDPFLLRDAAQHKDVNTTNGYVRGRSEGANNVVRMRQGK
ncbi:MAG: tyrosine-type recombinase/integrase [Pikeienuella sp.]